MTMLPFGDIRSALHAETLDAQALRSAILGHGNKDEVWAYVADMLAHREGAQQAWGWGLPPARHGVLLGWPHWWSDDPSAEGLGTSAEVARVEVWDGVAIELWRADASSALHLWACDMMELALTIQTTQSAHLPLAWQATRVKRRWLMRKEPDEALATLGGELDALALTQTDAARAKLAWAARWSLATEPLLMLAQLHALLPLTALDPGGERLGKHLERLAPRQQRASLHGPHTR